MIRYGTYGCLESSPDGLTVQCHLCGAWVSGLGQHGWMAHQLRAAEYRVLCGLMAKTGLASPALKQRRSELIHVSAWKCSEEERVKNLMTARKARLAIPTPYRPRTAECALARQSLTRTQEDWERMSKKGVAARLANQRKNMNQLLAPTCAWCHDPIVGAHRRTRNTFCCRACYVRSLQGKDPHNLPHRKVRLTTSMT